MPFMDRDSFIELLNRLGDEDDQVALAAARTLHARVTASGFGWDGLLVGTDSHGATTVPEVAIAPAAPAEDESDEALIERLLRDFPLSDETRGDLLDMKEQAARGALPPDDGKYVRDLAIRLAQKE